MPRQERIQRQSDIRRAELSSAAAPRRKRKAQRVERKGQGQGFFSSCFSPLLTIDTRHSQPSSHLNTWFALASTSGGIVNPICFAAFKLITNSNFVACCTGKSAGLSPFNILST